MEEQEQEHEVYGGEIPGDDGDMDADIDMSSRHDDDQGYDDANSKVCFCFSIPPHFLKKNLKKKLCVRSLMCCG